MPSLEGQCAVIQGTSSARLTETRGRFHRGRSITSGFSSTILKWSFFLWQLRRAVRGRRPAGWAAHAGDVARLFVCEMLTRRLMKQASGALRSEVSAERQAWEGEASLLPRGARGVPRAVSRGRPLLPASASSPHGGAVLSRCTGALVSLSLSLFSSTN